MELGETGNSAKNVTVKTLRKNEYRFQRTNEFMYLGVLISSIAHEE